MWMVDICPGKTDSTSEERFKMVKELHKTIDLLRAYILLED